MSTCIRQTAASYSKLVFSSTFIFCSPIYTTNFGVVFLWKCIFAFEKWFFSFDRLNMQTFTLNITRVVWPHVTNLPDLRYFCRHHHFFYHLNSLLKLAKKYLFFGEYFCLTYFLHVEKKHQNKDSFNNDRYYRIYWASSF